MTNLSLLDILNLIGVFACAVTGALQAGRIRMDYFGVLIIGAVTGLGGGTIRDVVLNHYPLSWVGDHSILYVVAGSVGLTILAAPFMQYLKSVFLFLDAIGLVAFSLIGAQVAMSMNYGVTITCVAAVCTGAFGGILRDLLCNRIPLAFQHELYASIALLIGAVYYFMIKLGINHDLSTFTSIFLGLAIRILAIRFSWSLPIFDYSEEKYQSLPWFERLPHKRFQRKLSSYYHSHFQPKASKRSQDANFDISTENFILKQKRQQQQAQIDNNLFNAYAEVKLAKTSEQSYSSTSSLANLDPDNSQNLVVDPYSLVVDNQALDPTIITEGTQDLPPSKDSELTSEVVSEMIYLAADDSKQESLEVINNQQETQESTLTKQEFTK